MAEGPWRKVLKWGRQFDLLECGHEIIGGGYKANRRRCWKCKRKLPVKDDDGQR